MHFAVRAECFCFHKRAAVASLCGIVGECLTFGAKSVLRAVLFPAIELYWIYNKKVDKYDIIEDRKRRNKNVFKEHQIHPGI